ncbi:uncharacterized protein LOC128960075 [Oppia nitens]|uniref:uncharacterized protein LOC128960075 n=1 Tax=Oppia nitens TaxID=1686743 RepID=UPI0023DC87A0|nr:uncharacterized protein LOC128960075 [Oppia nitens]
MSNIMTSLSGYSNCDKIAQHLIETIKLFYVFDDCRGPNLLFVTNDDKVYALGSNQYGSLGLGHKQQIVEPVCVPELSGQQIQQFVNGSTFAMAITGNHQVFGWGLNSLGQLARNRTEPTVYLKPDKVIFPEDSASIVQLSCGQSHVLALTTDGNVYAWGSNNRGQLGCGLSMKVTTISDKPIKVSFRLDNDLNINLIYCTQMSSFAITGGVGDGKGRVYSWGDNNYHQLGHRHESSLARPKLIKKLKHVHCVCYSWSAGVTYFLTKRGKLYYCGGGSKEVNGSLSVVSVIHPKLIKSNLAGSSLKFSTMYHLQSYQRQESFINLVTDNKIYCLINGTDISETDFNNIRDYYRQRCRMTFETYKYVHNYDNGAFGQVFKVRQKSDNRPFAIKTILLEDFSDETKQKALQEAQGLANVKSKYVVDYRNSWIEDNQLYIQMEYCSTTLADLLQMRSNIFNRSSDQTMDSLEFYMSCELFKEVLECVHYIQHENIIHRDLKPENFLFADIHQQLSAQYLRLGDFGIAIEANSLQIAAGTPKYMAPEISRGLKATLKSDIYSVGCIGQDLFDICLTDSNRIGKYKDHQLCSYFLELNKHLSQMVVQVPKKRPELKTVLEMHEKWSPDNVFVKNDDNFSNRLDTIEQLDSGGLCYDLFLFSA